MTIAGSGNGAVAPDWLEGILKKAAELPAEFLADNVEDDVDPKDKVLGTLPDNLVRLRGLSNQIHEQAKDLRGEHSKKFGKAHLHTGPECEAYEAQSIWLDRQANLVIDLFWVSTINHFGAQGSDLALRKGNVLVETPEDRDEDRDGRGIRATMIEIPMPKGLMDALMGLSRGERATQES